MTREEMSKAIQQHARLTAQVVQGIASKSGFTAENILEAIRIEARQIIMSRRRRNGFDPPSNTGEGGGPEQERPPP